MDIYIDYFALAFPAGDGIDLIFLKLGSDCFRIYWWAVWPNIDWGADCFSKKFVERPLSFISSYNLRVD